MEIEIISSMEFDEYNERLYYTSLQDDKNEITRRDFIKYLAIGGTGLLLPMYSSKDAHAVAPAILIYYLGIFSVGVLRGLNIFGSDDRIECSVKLKNDGTTAEKANIGCKIHDSGRDLVYNKSRKSEKIKPQTIVTANIKTTNIEDKGKYTVLVETERNNKTEKITIV